MWCKQHPQYFTAEACVSQAVCILCVLLFQCMPSQILSHVVCVWQPVFSERKVPRFMTTGTHWQQPSAVPLRYLKCGFTWLWLFPFFFCSQVQHVCARLHEEGMAIPLQNQMCPSSRGASLDLCASSSGTSPSLVLRFLFHDEWLVLPFAYFKKHWQ